MRQVAIAFTTTGPSPKEGHRISDLVAVEQTCGTRLGRTLHLIFRADDAQDEKPTLAMEFDELDELIADAPIVVHHAGLWRKFMRVELRDIKKRGARRLLKQVVDVTGWAHSRYPKQRKSLEAIARKCGIADPEGMTGLRLDAERIRLIAQLMSQEPTPAPVIPAVSVLPPTEEAPHVAGAPAHVGWVQRLLDRFKVLAGSPGGAERK